MPTPTGLPKQGERWRLTIRTDARKPPEHHDVIVLERSGGSYWSLRVRSVETGETHLWVDAAAWHSGVMGSHRLTYVQPTAGERVEQQAPQPQKEERTPLGVVVVIAGEDPHQCEHWKAALDYVDTHARGGDPVQVSMFTLYWGEDD